MWKIFNEKKLFFFKTQQNQVYVVNMEMPSRNEWHLLQGFSLDSFSHSHTKR